MMMMILGKQGANYLLRKANIWQYYDKYNTNFLSINLRD